MAKGKDVADGRGHDEIVTRLVEYTGGEMQDRVRALPTEKRVSRTRNKRELDTYGAKGVNHVQVYIQYHETVLLS